MLKKFNFILNSVLSFPPASPSPLANLAIGGKLQRGERRRESNSDRELVNWIPAFAGMTTIFLLITFYLSLITPVYADHCPVDETHTDFDCISNDPLKFATSIYGIGLGLIGAVGLLSIIYGAFLVLTSQGDPVRLQNGRSYIMYALIGMGLAVGGYAFYRIIATNVIKLPGFS